MCLSNATIRRRLREYARLFAERNCEYYSGENKAAIEVLVNIQEVWPAGEAYNKKHPNHGKKISA